AEDGIRDRTVTGVQTCALPIFFPYLAGDDVVSGTGPTRWVIDFAQRELFDALQYKTAFERLKERVMSDVVAKAETERLATGKDRSEERRVGKEWRCQRGAEGEK